MPACRVAAWRELAGRVLRAKDRCQTQQSPVDNRAPGGSAAVAGGAVAGGGAYGQLSPVAASSGSGHTREASDAVDDTGCAGVRGHGRSHRYNVSPKPARYLWERACPRSRRRGGWHRLGRCSRLKPLLQVPREPEACAVPVGAGSPAKQATRWMAPAAPVFAATAAPTGTA